MKRYIITAGLAISSILMFSCVPKESEMTRKSFAVAAEQYTRMLEHATDMTRYPRTMDADGSVRMAGIDNWTGGFWPGALWYLYEYTGDEKWLKAATEWTESLESNKTNTTHHDIGFMMYCSYGNALRLTGNQAYENVLIESANSLCARYSPQVGSIMSWNPRKSLGDVNDWDFPVIIDNMMNLELLFHVFDKTGWEMYREVALRHAETTMNNHIRPDNSTYHVVNYDPLTGQALHHQTAQGFADNSTWARGQAWGIYGFTMTYRFTHDERFLDAAQRLADFFIDNPDMPGDMVPYWDFNVGRPGYTPDWAYDPARFTEEPRDASAAAIAASALIELSGYASGETGAKYLDAARKMLRSLASEKYLATPGTNANFVIRHCVGNMPGNNEVDVPLVYADYYFLEALHRLQKLHK